LNKHKQNTDIENSLKVDDVHTRLLRRLKYVVTIFSIYSGIHVIQSNLLNRFSNYAILPNVTLMWVAPLLFFISAVYLMLLSVSPPP